MVTVIDLGTSANAQTLNPTVTGENMLCPEGTGVVSTQVFDTYQWHRRYLGSSQTQSLPGQVFQQLVMDYHNFAASYVSVTVTQGGQTATSPEFFVDGYVFCPLCHHRWHVFHWPRRRDCLVPWR
ncbi:MAG: hypothetical protein IPM52_10280 [Bacteroidetes bacterium]|nr:hypothetical protein [Bacteroidota bacterium]